MSSPDIFTYLDYREFCRDYYVSRKQSDSRFSYRFFSKKALVAPAYLKHVIDGKRNLSPEMSVRFGYGMDLSEKEIEYFENLVRFNQASNLEEKTHYFEGLRKKRARTLKDLTMTEAAALLSHWYVVAIKELVVNLNTIDAPSIQKVLRRKLSESLIQRTIEDLQSLGWLECVDGEWRSLRAQIKFPDEVKSYVIQSFHVQMLEIAQEALEDELDQREFGAAVFSFPKERLPELKKKIKSLQADLISYVQDVSDTDLKLNDRKNQKIYFFGVQCFSLQKGDVNP